MRRIVVLLAAGFLFACSGEESSAPQSNAAASMPPPPSQPAAQGSQGSQNADQGAPAAQPQRMSQEEREAALANRRFQEGQHYSRLTPAQPTVETEGNMIEVVEVFQYSCPACNNFEPYINAWLETKADYVNFVRVPAAWNQLGELHARAFYTAEALGIIEESHDAFFTEFHRNRNYLQSEADLADFYSNFGVDEDTFLSTFNSFAVHTKLQRADDLIQRYQVSGTPGIVIHGKYTASGSQAGSYENWFAIIDELAAVEYASASE
jgi:thiol:disulfide interchange protein DsbA